MKHEINIKQLKHSNATHISDHIHNSRLRRHLIKTFIPNYLLVEWFIKSLFPSITEDIAKGRVITEEQVISHS